MSLFHCLQPGLPAWEIQRDGLDLAIGFDISPRSLQVPSYTLSNPSFTICPFLVHQSFWKAFVSLKRIHLQWICSILSPQQIHEEIQETPPSSGFPQNPSPSILYVGAMRIQRFSLSFHWMKFLSSSWTKFSSPGGSSGRSVSVCKGKTEHNFTIIIHLLKSELQQSWAQLSKQKQVKLLWFDNFIIHPTPRNCAGHL